MNVRICWVRAMECMCAQTRPRFTLSSERVWGEMESEPMLTPREKSPLPEAQRRIEPAPLHHANSEPSPSPTELFRPGPVYRPGSYEIGSPPALQSQEPNSRFLFIAHFLLCLSAFLPLFVSTVFLPYHPIHLYIFLKTSSASAITRHRNDTTSTFVQRSYRKKLVYIAQFDTHGLLTVLYIVI